MSDLGKLREKIDNLKPNRPEGQETPWPIPTLPNDPDEEDQPKQDDDVFFTPSDFDPEK